MEEEALLQKAWNMVRRLPYVMLTMRREEICVLIIYVHMYRVFIINVVMDRR